MTQFSLHYNFSSLLRSINKVSSPRTIFCLNVGFFSKLESSYWENYWFVSTVTSISGLPFEGYRSILKGLLDELEWAVKKYIFFSFGFTEPYWTYPKVS